MSGQFGTLAMFLELPFGRCTKNGQTYALFDLFKILNLKHQRQNGEQLFHRNGNILEHHLHILLVIKSTIFYDSDFYVYEVGKRLFSKYHNICISINNHKLACQKLKSKIQLRKNFYHLCFRTFSFAQGLIEKFDLGG